LLVRGRYIRIFWLNGIVVLDTVSAIPLVRIFGSVQVAGLLGVIALTCTWMKANSSIQSTTAIIAYHPAAEILQCLARGKRWVSLSPNEFSFTFYPQRLKVAGKSSTLGFQAIYVRLLRGCGPAADPGTPLSPIRNREKRPKVLGSFRITSLLSVWWVVLEPGHLAVEPG